ncbi:MAG: DUF2318 domain-containing protein [Candidatus Bipolaricaulis sp.]|nr:DUF2318 domain-containing protein [Candidatus Bipolaricaulis sp.]
MNGMRTQTRTELYELALRLSRRTLRRVGNVSAVLALGVCLALGVASFAADAQSKPLATAFATPNHDPFLLVTADTAGDVRLELAGIPRGVASFYTFMAAGLPVEFFVVWTQDNVIRTAFNACDACYRAKLGYHQDGLFMVCNNCGNRFPVERIGIAVGGCNPAPFAARVDGQELVISVAVLAAGLSYFP